MKNSKNYKLLIKTQSFILDALPISFYSPYLLGYFFVALLAVLIFKKTFYPRRFSEYFQLLVNNKYILIYGKKDKILYPFNLSGIIFHLIFISVYVWLWLYQLYPKLNFSWSYALMASLLFYVVKILMQYAVSFILDISTIASHYLFLRSSYNNYAAMLAFCILTISVYGFNHIMLGLILSGITYLFVYGLGLWQILKSFRGSVFLHLFYFILYLCTFEIAPCLTVAFIVTRAN